MNMSENRPKTLNASRSTSNIAKNAQVQAIKTPRYMSRLSSADKNSKSPGCLDKSLNQNRRYLLGQVMEAPQKPTRRAQGDRDHQHDQERLKAEIKTIKDNLNGEITTIQSEINKINDKLKFQLPAKFLASISFCQIKAVQYAGVEQVEGLQVVLEKLKATMEQVGMTREEFHSLMQAKTETVMKTDENYVMLDICQNILENNEEAIEGLKEDAKLKDQMHKAAKELEGIEAEIVGLNETLKEKEALIVAELNQINDLNGETRQILAEHLETKNQFIHQFDWSKSSIAKADILDLLDSTSHYDPLGFNKEIKEVGYDLQPKLLESLYKRFMEGLTKIFYEFDFKHKLISEDTGRVEGYITASKSALESCFNLYRSNIKLFSKSKALLGEKESISAKLETLGQRKAILDEEIDGLQVRIDTEIPKGSGDDKIDYRKLDESLTESFFMQSQVSMCRLELKEKINKQQILEALQSVENIEEENGHLNARLVEFDKGLTKVRARNINLSGLAGTLKAEAERDLQALVRNLEDETGCLTSMMESRCLAGYELTPRKGIQRFCDSLIDMNKDLVSALLRAQGNHVDLHQTLNRLMIKKMEYLKQHWKPSAVNEDKLKSLKSKLKAINQVELPKIQKLAEEVNQPVERNPNDLSNIDITGSQRVVHRKQTLGKESTLSFDFLKRLYLKFKGVFYVDYCEVIAKLEAGVSLYHKANFNKSFDLKKFVELKEIKKIRVSLENYGFVKKTLKFDPFQSAVFMSKPGSRQKDVIPLEAFGTLALTPYSLQLVKVKTNDVTANGLMIYDQKDLIMMERTEYTELTIEDEGKGYGFVCEDLEAAVLLIFASRIDFLEQFEARAH